jgi:hypothetical protein
LKVFVGCCQPFVAEAVSVAGNYLIIGFSYKTMTMLWCFGNIPVDLNLLIFVDFVLGYEAGLLQGSTSGQDLMPEFVWLQTSE